jgi:starch phosphorylase
LSAWKARVRTAWPGVAVVHVESGGVDAIPQVGDELHLRARVQLNGLKPEDVSVQVIYGRSQNGDELTHVRIRDLEVEEKSAIGGAYEYVGTVALSRAGSFGYTVRIVPRNDLLLSSAELGLVAIAG